MTAEEFVHNVLDACSDAKNVGLVELGQQSSEHGGEPRIPEVSSLARSPLQETDYLIGEQPTWADIQSGRAVHREFDNEITDIIDRYWANKNIRRPILITGTAGSGKSTSLMRVCLRLAASGVRIGWIDRNLDIRPGAIRSLMIDPKFQIPFNEDEIPVHYEGGAGCEDAYARIQEKEHNQRPS